MGTALLPIVGPTRDGRADCRRGARTGANRSRHPVEPHLNDEDEGNDLFSYGHPEAIPLKALWGSAMQACATNHSIRPRLNDRAPGKRVQHLEPQQNDALLPHAAPSVTMEAAPGSKAASRSGAMTCRRWRDRGEVSVQARSPRATSKCSRLSAQCVANILEHLVADGSNVGNDIPAVALDPDGGAELGRGTANS